MSLPYNCHLLSHARRLRREMTKEERHLWYDFLKDYPAKIYKQKIVGNYILDFYCEKANLAIELDGSQHYEPAQQAHDRERTAFLNELGIEVFRISNLDVIRNFAGVCAAIDEKIGAIAPLSQPAADSSPQGEPDSEQARNKP